LCAFRIVLEVSKLFLFRLRFAVFVSSFLVKAGQQYRRGYACAADLFAIPIFWRN
jgi:hypothetical protein